MAEALVSIVLKQLASITRQQAEEGIRLISGAEPEVEKLQSNFLAIQAVLADAEDQQLKKNYVRVWLDKLKDVSYDIDDVLDEWNTKLQKLQIKKAQDASKPLKKVCSLIHHYLSYRPFVLRYDIAVKIKDLDRKLDVIAVEKDRFNFRSITEGSKEVEWKMTTSAIDVTEVYGRDDEKNRIVDMLLSQSSQQQVLPIISIVGMGGIGKTTLAQLVFNDDKVIAHFDKKLWVCVSKPFDELRIAKAILESLTNIPSQIVELETVMQNIRRLIEGKKFILVLDNVWTENPENWENLKHTLKCGSLESRILVTTRKENVANVIRTTNVISLGILPEEECWSLFCQLAFSGKPNSEFVEIGKKIVQKCKGLPLAVKTLGSLLCFKRKFDDWENVLNSEIWALEVVERRIFPPLLLSYYDLPSILKKCFSYCAIFPKDHEIIKKDLIKLWMAQDYLSSNSNKDMELVGEEYFENLAKRSFFQDFQQGKRDIGIFACKMHDIVHDFAQFLTQNECFTIEVVGPEGFQLESSNNRVRHSMIQIKTNVSFPSSFYTNNKFLRTFVVESFPHDPKIVWSKLVDQLTCLRSLCLNLLFIEQLPREIKKLIHLRYLDLTLNTKLKELPETLCELYNLQTLSILGCTKLKKLPKGIGNLINLRHLLNWAATNISYMPKSLERLTSLRSLGEFYISEDNSDRKTCSVECLKDFKYLREIDITGLGNLRDMDKVKGIELNKKKSLRDLGLDFQGKMNEEHEELLEALQPHPNLEILRLRNYEGYRMSPNWMMSVTNLRKLSLEECIICEHLPPLGKLPSLEILEINEIYGVERVGVEFLGIESEATSSSSVIAFPKLKFLLFEEMEDWEEWDLKIANRGGEDITIMPSLQNLRIKYCPKLKSLPSYLRQNTTLKIKIIECPLLEEQRTHNGSSYSTDRDVIIL